MTRKLFRHTLILLLACFMSGTLICCYDYDESLSKIGKGSEKEYAFAFDISLNSISGSATRAEGHFDTYGEALENQIDIEGKNHDFRILLFDKNDKYLFDIGQIKYDIEPIDDNGAKRWRVLIPSSALTDETLKKIEVEGFKIAVLANWPTKYQLKFEEGDDLYKLSHYYEDGEYANSAYSHLPASGNLMGAYMEWVKNTYLKQADAREVIRNTERDYAYQIDRKVYSDFYKYTYKHIWRVWNFGNEELLDDITTNGNFINFWAGKIDKEELQKISSTGLSNYGAIYDDVADGLTFTTDDGNMFNDANNSITIKQGLTSNEHSNGADIEKSYFSFDAYAAGTLVVWARSNSDNPTYIGVQQGDYNSEEDRIDNRNALTGDKKVGDMPSAGTYKHEFSVSVTGTNTDGNSYKGKPVNVKVYAIDGDVDILQIEYIEDDYLYNTDREGYLPSKERLIPMYGIQEFGPIGKFLVPDKVFNLSENTNEDGYDHKKIYLLRSVAKVELLIPSSFPKLTHAYMRCSNRSSRCEPVDVSKPTDESWDDIDTEIDNIREYGPFYKSETNNTENYRKRLAWFYTAWTTWKNPWQWNTKEGQTFTVPSTDYEYPHIFNSRISRSDYIQFKPAEQTKEGYDRYVLYVPEKNIEDPNSKGSLNSTPKVPHIELRFEGNGDTNLDDNDCWRMYFRDKQPQVAQDKYDDFEKDVNNLKTLYPIVRNHIYRFTINSSGRNTVCTVCEWDNQETKIKFE